jgi:hypothetical protein
MNEKELEIQIEKSFNELKLDNNFNLQVLETIINEKEIEIIFNDKKLNNFDNYLTLIPDDVKRNIYENFFSPKKLINELLDELNSISCKQLEIKKIVPLLKIVLENKMAFDYFYNQYYYLCPYSNKKSNFFRLLYDQIILKKKKNFIKIQDPLEDFCLSWLMYLYH